MLIGLPLLTSVEFSMNSAASAGAVTADNAAPRISQRIPYFLCLSVIIQIPKPTAIVVQALAEIEDGLVPALQARGLVRKAYSFMQFRDNLLEF